jgi:hypothetical protein
MFASLTLIGGSGFEDGGFEQGWARVKRVAGAECERCVSFGCANLSADENEDLTSGEGQRAILRVLGGLL